MTDLSIRDLYVERDARRVLGGCNAEFAGRKRTVLWGHSGAGKSTLLSAIAGLVTPRRGTIAFGSSVWFSAADGIDVPPHKRRIGYVFQDLALWPHLTVFEQVRLAGRQAGLEAAAIKALLDSVQLTNLAARRPSQLSGGEQQRLAIARALAGQPLILLLDEPLSSVDHDTRQPLYTLIRAISAQVPGPTIYVTHDFEQAQSLSEHGFRLSDGVLTAVDQPWQPVA